MRPWQSSAKNNPDTTMIRLLCPVCKQPLEAMDADAGRRVRCPFCQAAIRVPTDEAEPVTFLNSGHWNLQVVQGMLLFVGLLIFVAVAAAGIIFLMTVRRNPGPARQALGRFGDVLVSLTETGSSLAWLTLILLLTLCYVVFVLGMTVWVARDARHRGDSPLGWAVFFLAWQVLIGFSSLVTVPLFAPRLIGLLLGWTGLFIYLGARRPGRLERCVHCDNLKLAYAVVCLHCGSRRGPRRATADQREDARQRD